MPERQNYRNECKRLRRLGDEAIRAGRLHDALELLDRNRAVAARSGDSVEIDRAECNFCALILQMGRIEEAIRSLGKILLRSPEPKIRRLAAYHMAWAYDMRKDWEKALLYARKAQEQARRVGRLDWIASGENQLGGILLASSHFDQAIEAFETALSLLPSTPSVERAVILDNLGYCFIVRGRSREGFRALFESLRTLRRFGARRNEVEPRLSLSYAYLEKAKPRASLRQGLAALAMAEEMGDSGSTKTALFLLGEAAKLLDNDLLATRYFRRLQEAYYPDQPALTDLLLVVDARSMVNLKA